MVYVLQISGRPAWVDVQMANRLKIPHTFVIHTYTKPTMCQLCQKMLVGVSPEGVRLVRNLGAVPAQPAAADVEPAASAPSLRFSELLGRAAGSLRR